MQVQSQSTLLRALQTTLQYINKGNNCSCGTFQANLMLDIETYAPWKIANNLIITMLCVEVRYTYFYIATCTLLLLFYYYYYYYCYYYYYYYYYYFIIITIIPNLTSPSVTNSHHFCV